MGDTIKELLRASLAEFLACLLFVFFGAGSVCGAIQSVDALATVNPNNFTVPDFVVTVEPINYSMAFGLAITALAFAIGGVSGGHINPAVTLAMMVTKNISPLRGGLYFLAQFAGGIVGGGLLCLSVGKENYHGGIGLSVPAGGGFLLELMGTLLLIFVVFNAAFGSLPGSTANAMAPVPIGFAVLVAHLTLGPFTGCGINPARVVGAVVWESSEWWAAHASVIWIYFAGPFAASLLGPLTYYALFGTVAPQATTDKEMTQITPLE